MRSWPARWGALVLLFGIACTWRAPASMATPAQPNDPAFGLQWNLRMIGAPSAWQVATGANTTIAIVDSGIDLNHEDLAAKIVDSVSCVGHPCVGGQGAAKDNNGHGTHVAGIAAAITDNGKGVAGVAPDARLMIVKALEQSCDFTGTCDASGNATDVANGIRYAADHGATVINLSLGNESQSIFGPAFQDALDYAWNKGAVPVLAAGNDFLLPSGGATHAVVVGALDKDGTRSTYSNIGTSEWSISAPGGSVAGDSNDSCSHDPESVLSTYPGGYACLSGTSMAAPHVSGAIAILRGMGYAPQDAVDRLLATARPAGAGTGAGALDLAAAVGEPATPPPDASSESSTGSVASAPASNNGGTVAATPAGTPGSTGSSDSSSSAAPAVITLPNQRAAGGVSGRVNVRAPSSGDDVPTAPVAVAVLLASSVGLASGALLLRGAGWARRTPPL